MPQNPWNVKIPNYLIGAEPLRRKSSRVNRTKERQIPQGVKHWAWDNLHHKCNICGKKVNKISEAEFDHTRAYSKSGTNNLSNIKIVHRTCNRIKGNKSLSETKKLLGIKPKTKKKKAKKVYRRK